MSQLATPFHILLIEADPTDARFFSNLLTQVKGFRFEVDVADSLTAASACLAQNGVDGVLLDPCLPGTAPKQAISAVLEQAVDVPVVVLVNPEMHELGVWAIVEGARDYLIKGEDDAQTVARSLRYAIQRQCAERALEASATRYRKLVEMSLDAVILTGPDMRILFANQRAIDMYGFDNLSRMIGVPVVELFALEDPTCVLDQIMANLRDGRLENAEFMFRRRDGECFPGELSISVLRDGDGELQGTIGIVRDVTERKRAEAAERQQRVFAEALYNAAAALNSTLDLDQVLDRILENVEPVVPHDGANIMLLEDGVVRVKRCRGYYDQHDFVDHLLALEGQLSEFYYLQEMARTRRPVVVSDVPGSPHWATNQPKNWMRSYVGAPITREGELMGFINADSAEPGAFTPEHGERLRVFAEQIALAIHNAQLYASEKARREVAEKLYRASAALGASLERDQVFSLILEQLGQVLRYDVAAIEQEQDDELVVQAVRGVPEVMHLSGLTWDTLDLLPHGRVGRQQSVFAVSNAGQSYPFYAQRFRDLTGLSVGSWLGVPLISRDQTIGLLAIARLAVDPFTPEEIELATAFSSHAASALQNARLYAELENYSSILAQAIREATSELRQTLEQREVILHNSPDSVLLLEADGSIELVNRTFQQVFEMKLEDVYGMQPIGLIDEASAASFQQALQAVIAEQTPRRIEAIARTRSGRRFDADIALAPVVENHTLYGIVCSLRDISTLKDIERMKDALVSTAAHELRTPLTTIQGFSELLLSRELSPERQARYLRFINEQSLQLASIIDNLLDLSRLEAGYGFQIAPEPVDIGKLVVEAALPFVETSPLHTFDMVDLSHLPPVFADPARLSQVVRNLVCNAVKYSPEGGVVRIRGWVSDDLVHISVEDEGIGIPREKQPFLFEKFYRVDTSDSAVGGTGLGLSICKLIVEQHGGRIGVKSEPGKGSTFTFCIPLTQQDAISAS